MQIFDTSNPISPILLSAWGGIDSDYSALDVEGGLAAVAEGRTVYLIDVVDPAMPELAGTATIRSGLAVRVVLRGTLLYVVTGTGLEVFDVTSPSAPAFLGAHATTAWSAALAVDGSTGYLVAGWGFIVGVLLFSGSLYGLTLGGPRILGPITPIGGLALLTGWFGLLYAALR